MANHGRQRRSRVDYFRLGRTSGLCPVGHMFPFGYIVGGYTTDKAKKIPFGNKEVDVEYDKALVQRYREKAVTDVENFQVGKVYYSNDSIIGKFVLKRLLTNTAHYEEVGLKWNGPDGGLGAVAQQVEVLVLETRGW